MLAQDQTTSNACITPTVELAKKIEDLDRIMNTHSWQVVKSESYGGDAIMFRLSCTKCGLVRLSIVSDIEDSAKRALSLKENSNAHSR